jgi:hypothetical protein
MEDKHYTVYFVGYAKLPSVMSASMAYGQLTLGLLIDVRTGLIEDVSCTLLSDLARNLVKSYVVGRHIVRDLDAITEEITYRHQGNAQRPLIKALGDIHRRYLEFMQTHPVPPSESVQGNDSFAHG